MRRRLVAAVWITGVTLPVLLATVFVVGCCVLPFHGLMHKLMPLCETAASVMRGDHPAEGHEHEALPPAPVREKQEPVKWTATVMPDAFPFSNALDLQRLIAPTASTGFRSFISLGAIRCDQDVGLHVLVQTYLI
ncbi:MAG: hypothetical protein JJE51_02955 [Thermoanaerobaculia bacterium]|nr:hypothetical protein [Thermoanaerobaculia bacterium]